MVKTRSSGRGDADTSSSGSHLQGRTTRTRRRVPKKPDTVSESQSVSSSDSGSDSEYGSGSETETRSVPIPARSKSACGQKTSKQVVSTSSCSEGEGAETTPRRGIGANTDIKCRSSERIRVRKNRKFHMPTKREVFEQIGEEVTSPVKRVRKTLASSFTRETHRYNWDEVNYSKRLESDASSAEDFINDDEMTSSDEEAQVAHQADATLTRQRNANKKRGQRQTRLCSGTPSKWLRLAMSNSSTEEEDAAKPNNQHQPSNESILDGQVDVNGDTEMPQVAGAPIPMSAGKEEEDSADIPHIETDDELDSAMLALNDRGFLPGQEGFRGTGNELVLSGHVLGDDKSPLVLVSDSKNGVTGALPLVCEPLSLKPNETVITEREQNTYWPTREEMRSETSGAPKHKPSEQQVVDDEEITPTQRRNRSLVIDSDNDSTSHSDASTDGENGAVLAHQTKKRSANVEVDSEDSESVRAPKVTGSCGKKIKLVIDSDEDEEDVIVELCKPHRAKCMTIPESSHGSIELQSPRKRITRPIIVSDEEEGNLSEEPIPVQLPNACGKPQEEILEVATCDDSTSRSDTSTDGENQSIPMQRADNKDTKSVMENNEDILVLDNSGSSATDTHSSSESDSASSSGEDIRGCSKRARLMKSKKDAWREKFENYKKARTKSVSDKGASG